MHRFSTVFDGRNLLEDLLKPTAVRNDGLAGSFRRGNTLLPDFRADKPLKALGLQRKQIRNLDGVADFGERQSLGDSTVLGSCR